MESIAGNGTGMRRSARISSQNLGVDKREKSNSIERSSSASGGKFKRVSKAETDQLQDTGFFSDEENVPTEESSSESDDSIPKKRNNRKSSKGRLTRKSVTKKKQKNKKSSPPFSETNILIQNDADGLTNTKKESIPSVFDKKADNFTMSVNLLDDSQFLLCAGNEFLQPSTSKQVRLLPDTGEITSGSEMGHDDDWEDVGLIHEPASGHTAVEVIIQKPEDNDEDDEAAQWEKMVRQGIARKRREMFDNCHKIHILCYIAHLRFMVKAIVESQAELRDALSTILPPELNGALNTAVMEQTVDMFRAAFTETGEDKLDFADVESSSPFIDRLKILVHSRVFDNDRDLAVLFFSFCYCVLKLTTRLCVAFNPTPKFEDEKRSSVDVKETKKNKSSSTVAESSSKIKSNTNSKSNKASSSKKESAKCDHVEDTDFDESSSDSEPTPKKRKSTSKKKAAKKAKTTAKKPAISAAKQSGSTKINKAVSGTRNYWVEFYDDAQQRWICVDPFFKKVDKLKEIEKFTVRPCLYVIGVDNEMGVRDLTAKYVTEYMTSKFRRHRADDEWLKSTFSAKLLRPDEARARKEDAEIRQHLHSLPMPTIVSEFKNNLLYVLERDLLKFEAIYPQDIEPLGEIRGHKIYPRNSVYTLQGELNWIKLARKVKKGEQPYKVVKARPKLNVPKEQRESLSLNVYGYWQTEPYVPDEVIDGRIPRNEFGNIYVYQESMIPKGCKHLRLNGVFQVARKLDLEAVPAIVGWEFSGCANHPVIDGCIVLEQDADILTSAWVEASQAKAEKEAKKVKERVWKNWRRLIKGKLLLEKMRSRFSGPKK
ncbi:rad4 beta-hairpin domain 3 domain-containing protein [Ditylenchus destructor]|nr:rad4 beta-hairpin domain 3 domain-containing protein [Ditylenchus destructor]